MASPEVREASPTRPSSSPSCCPGPSPGVRRPRGLRARPRVRGGPWLGAGSAPRRPIAGPSGCGSRRCCPGASWSPAAIWPRSRTSPAASTPSTATSVRRRSRSERAARHDGASSSSPPAHADARRASALIGDRGAGTAARGRRVRGCRRRLGVPPRAVARSRAPDGFHQHELVLHRRAGGRPGAARGMGPARARAPSSGSPRTWTSPTTRSSRRRLDAGRQPTGGEAQARLVQIAGPKPTACLASTIGTISSTWSMPTPGRLGFGHERISVRSRCCAPTAW